MDLTQEDIIRSGYKLQAAAVDAWRAYDEDNPIPRYFDFDWLSSRHPDLYHSFALSSDGLMEKLHGLIDLAGCEVLDIGAGTGRSAAGAARRAQRVFALDLYRSVVRFGKRRLEQERVTNVHYLNGDREHLPFPQNRFDVVINAWAELNPWEAYRVLKPGGWLIQMGAAADALCGELTAELAPEFPWLVQGCAPAEVFEPGYPDECYTADSYMWNGIPVVGAVTMRRFTCVSQYEDFSEIAAMAGRLYGPKAKRYFLSRKQSTFSWRLQISMGRVSK